VLTLSATEAGDTASVSICIHTPNRSCSDWDEDGIYDIVDPPENAEQCRGGNWTKFIAPETFKNQGQCVAYTKTRK
jgi:hypothetical protein